jgi:hypothetical protein
MRFSFIKLSDCKIPRFRPFKIKNLSKIGKKSFGQNPKYCVDPIEELSLTKKMKRNLFGLKLMSRSHLKI